MMNQNGTMIVDLNTNSSKNMIVKVLLLGGTILAVLFVTAVVMSLKYGLPLWTGAEELIKQVPSWLNGLIPNLK